MGYFSYSVYGNPQLCRAYAYPYVGLCTFDTSKGPSIKYVMLEGEEGV